MFSRSNTFKLFCKQETGKGKAVWFCLVSCEEGRQASKGNNVQIFLKPELTMSMKTKVYMLLS